MPFTPDQLRSDICTSMVFFCRKYGAPVSRKLSFAGGERMKFKAMGGRTGPRFRK